MIDRPNSKAIDRKRRLALPHADLPIRDPEERARLEPLIERIVAGLR